MVINRFQGAMRIEDLRIAAKFLRFELPTGADALQLAKVAAFLDRTAQQRQDAKDKNREQGIKEGRAEKTRERRAVASKKYLQDLAARKKKQAIEKAEQLMADATQPAEVKPARKGRSVRK